MLQGKARVSTTTKDLTAREAVLVGESTTSQNQVITGRGRGSATTEKISIEAERVTTTICQTETLEVICQATTIDRIDHATQTSRIGTIEIRVSTTESEKELTTVKVGTVETTEKLNLCKSNTIRSKNPRFRIMLLFLVSSERTITSRAVDSSMEQDSTSFNHIRNTTTTAPQVTMSHLTNRQPNSQTSFPINNKKLPLIYPLTRTKVGSHPVTASSVNLIVLITLVTPSVITVNIARLTKACPLTNPILCKIINPNRQVAPLISMELTGQKMPTTFNGK